MANSLIFYSGKNYADNTPKPVAHGDTDLLAASTDTWTYQSVGVFGMQSFVFSDVNTTNASMSYLGHVESVISANIPDLTALYPSSEQFPLKYLGLDPTMATIVWLNMSGSSALASTSLVGVSTNSVTTLSLPEVSGALAFVGMAEGSSVVANCQYGDYDAESGIVAWAGSGTIVLEYINSAITVLAVTNFPADWSFGTPAPQSDGSWRIDVETGSAATNIIKDVQTDKESISNNGTDAAMLTATVVDSVSGVPVQGVTVSWSTTLGNLSKQTSQTDGNGQATTSLTDNGGTGKAEVTATIPGNVNYTYVDIVSMAPTIAFVTNAPALNKLNKDETYLTTNKIVVRGSVGESIFAMIQGESSALFENGSTEVSYTVPETGVIEFGLTDKVIESVNLFVQVGSTRVQGLVDFVDFPFQGDLRLIANYGAPADGVSVNSVYIDTAEITPKTVTVKLFGGAVFEGTDLTLQVLDFSKDGVYDKTFDIVSDVSGTMRIYCDFDDYGTIEYDTYFS